MQKKDIYITDLDFDYKLWKNKLNFYQNELNIYDYRLEELISSPKNQILENEIHSFQSSLHHVQDEVDKIDKAIRQNEEEIAHFVKDYPIDERHDHFKEHQNIHREMNSLEVHIKALKEDINSELHDNLFLQQPNT